MLKKLKNYQILDLVEAFTKIGEKQIVSNKKFSYALILNDEAIKSHVKAMQTVATPGENYIEYEQKRNDIIKDFAKVDGDGNIIINEINGVVFQDGKDKEAKEALKVLGDENSDILAERDKDIAEYNELLMKEVEVNIQEVDLDDVPDIIGEDLFLMKLLMHMIS